MQTIKSEMQKGNSPENIKAKKEELVKLGVPAVPFIMEEVKAGNEDMTEVVKAIISDDTTLPADKDMSKWKNWANDNENKYKKIKDMVQNVK